MVNILLQISKKRFFCPYTICMRIINKKEYILMNRKQLIVAAMAAMLSVSAANAAVTSTDITGITGNNGVFNIDPAKISGDVGYRYYDNFNLKDGDIANLIYQGLKNGKPRDIEAFINLVQNRINIDGVLNTVRNNNFYNGHAIFVSPNGMAVGASGVLNVGTLSVVTPTNPKFNTLKDEVVNGWDFTETNKVSALKKDGNAPINIQGYVFARNGIHMPGTNIDISGKVVNGLAAENLLDSKTAAENLFNSLVNTDGSIKAANSAINDNGSLVFINSFDKGNTTDGINISGNVVNLTQGDGKNGSVAITNNGANGTNISGNVAANGKLSVYNKNGDLNVSGVLQNKNDVLAVTNAGRAFETTSAARLKTNNNLEVVNNGTGALTMAGNAVSQGKTDIVNRSNAGMDITATVGDKNTTPSVRIINHNGRLAFTGTAKAAESVSLRNHGENGMQLGGTVEANHGILVHNTKGAATLTGTLKTDNGDVAVFNEGGTLSTTDTSRIENGLLGRVAIKNTSTGGMRLEGTIVNDGELAINNLAGNAVVNGKIDNTTGNMGIINKENGTGLTIGAVINNTEGKMNIINASGDNGLTIDGLVANNNRLYVYNDAGHMTINGAIANNAGDVHIASKNNSTGITTSADSNITNYDGVIAINHKGTGTAVNARGLDLNGTVEANDGQIAINNYKGDMHVGGTVNAKGDNLGIINRAGGNSMLVDAKITADNATTNIKNYGSGDITVNGDITHNGRLNVIANEGNLNLGGQITNESTNSGQSGWTYVVARKDKSGTAGDGIDVKSTFNANSTNGGTVLIKNISGQNGLKYQGNMTTTNGQAEIYNKAGDMVVNGGSITGSPAVILNTGKKLTVTEDVTLRGNEIKVVNKGTEAADVPTELKNSGNFREKVQE